jgi:hypothetical protein
MKARMAQNWARMPARNCPRAARMSRNWARMARKVGRVDCLLPAPYCLPAGRRMDECLDLGAKNGQDGDNDNQGEKDDQQDFHWLRSACVV